MQHFFKQRYKVLRRNKLNRKHKNVEMNRILKTFIKAFSKRKFEADSQSISAEVITVSKLYALIPTTIEDMTSLIISA